MRNSLRILTSLAFLFLLGNGLEAQMGPAFFEYPSAFGCSAPFSPPIPVSNLSTSGGTFTSSPAGLSLDPNSGTIVTSTSQLGTYVVTHIVSSPSADTHSVTITLLEIPNAQLSYPTSLACTETYDLLQVDSVVASGSYSASPPGLSIDPNTGTVDVDASLPGIYTITHIATNGPCEDTALFTLEIQSLGGFQLQYPQDTFCPTGTILPIAQPPIPGIYAATAGLLYTNDSIGEIGLGSTTPDREYIIRYIEDGGCERVLTDTFYVEGFDDASFSYGTFRICSNLDSLVPTIGADTGTFTWFGNFVVDILDINPATGTIYLPNSDRSIYDITHTTNGRCPSSETVTIQIVNSPSPFSLINYGDTLLEAPVTGGGFLRWFCDSTEVLSGTPFLPLSMIGVYWATLTNSDGCTTMSNVINTDPTDVAEGESLRNLVQVFPNPTTDWISIRTELSQGGELRAELFDVTGKKLLERNIPALLGGDMDLSTLPTGAFILRLSHRNATAVYHLQKVSP